MKAVLGFLTGIIIGGTAALLLAPESGEKTRRELSKKGKKLREELEQQAKQGKDKLEDMRKKSSQKLSDFRENSQEAMEEAAKRLNNSGSSPRNPALD